jgi:hypothetical protein
MPRRPASTETEPRPTQAAFKPADKNDFRNDLLIAGFCLAGFLLGLGANLFGDLEGFLRSTERTLNNQPTSFWLQLLIYFGFPLFLVAAGYFLRNAWIRRRETRRFEQEHASGQAVITHLWKEPPSGSGKKYFIGYRTAENQTARQEVSVYEFKRLRVGQILDLDFLPDKPQVSHAHIPPAGKRALDEASN